VGVRLNLLNLQQLYLLKEEEVVESIVVEVVALSVHTVKG